MTALWSAVFYRGRKGRPRRSPAESFAAARADVAQYKGEMDSLLALFRDAPSRVGFEDVLRAAERPEGHMVISTLPAHMQGALIPHTLPCADEEDAVNDAVASGAAARLTVLVYGRDASDPSAEAKVAQLRALGFADAHAYCGGMLEYLLLRDAYGAAKFPLEGPGARSADPLSYRPPARLGGARARGRPASAFGRFLE